MGFLLDHTRFGFCWLDLVALLILACVAAYAYVKLKKAKETKQELKDKLDEIESRVTAENSSGININNLKESTN